MSENAVQADPALTKEKKTLDPRIAAAIMAIMVICALLIGAGKAWKKNRTGVDAGYALWQENVQQRVETAYNLLTVAGRHLSQDNSLLSSVRSDLSEMQKVSAQQNDDDQRESASERFITDAQALLAALADSATVKVDSRDAMYVSLMLPQAIEQCSGSASLDAYNAAAESYNDGLHSFSGLLARLTGVKFAHVIQSAPPAASDAVVSE